MSIFTRRHYEFFTQVCEELFIDTSMDDMNQPGAKLAIYKIADALAAESLGFDKQLFLDNVLKS